MSKLLLSLFPILLLISSCTNNANRYIRIFSEESIEVPVSYAIINTGISITGKDVAKLDSTSHDKIVKGLHVINKYGVKEINTSNSSIEAEYDNKENFISAQSYKIKFYDIGKIDALRAELLNIGFNAFNVVSYGSDSLERYEKELYRKAIKNSQKEANELAKNSGIKIGKICKIVNGREPSEDENEGFSQLVSAEIFGKGGFAKGIEELIYTGVKPTIVKKTFTINNSFTIYFEISGN